MKKFLLFVTLCFSGITMGQENIPSANNYTETFSNYRSELGSGNFVYNVPLYDIETIDGNLSLRGNLYYNAQAASSVYTSEGIMDRGWSVDFLPSIYRDIEEIGTFWDESYYKVNSVEVDEDYTKPERALNDLFQINVFGIKASFRLKYHDNNKITVDLINSNKYIEIIPDYTMSSGNGDAKIIDLLGFKIKDVNGYIYSFNTPEESGSIQVVPRYDSTFKPMASLALDGKEKGYVLYKKAFLLSRVEDKYGRTLLEYYYKTYPNTIGSASESLTYNQKVIDYIDVVNKAKLVFNTDYSKVTSMEISNNQNQFLQKISISPKFVRFYDKNNIEVKHYYFEYYSKIGITSAINNYGNYLKTDACIDQYRDSWVYNNEVQYYSAGLLKTIRTPYKGKISIEYETNTYSAGDMGERLSELNYEYTEVPVTYNSVNDSYSFSYGTLDMESGEAYYLKFTSTLYTNPLFTDENGNPLSIYPGMHIPSNDPLYPSDQIFGYERQCTYGTKIKGKASYFNTTLFLFRTGGKPSNISNVKIYKKTKKPESQRINYCFGPSVRLKKITSNDDYTGTLLNEKIYSYNDPTDERNSSGVVWHFLWHVNSDDLIPIFYRYITEQEVGKGKTIYQMNMDTWFQFTAKEKEFLVKNIWKYNEAGELTEHINNEFENYKLSDDAKAEELLKKIKSVIKTYEGTEFKTTVTEKVFDTISRYPILSKVMDETIGETFEEYYTYEKLGNAYYQTKIDKFKNATPLNRSEFEYQQHGTTQTYNLVSTKVAKGSLPLGIEKEITRYDDYGNVLEYKTKEGMVVSQIWGYGNSKLVAELKNVPYASINTTTINSIKANSNTATFNETTLISLLNGLRATYPNGFITTYTYKPLVGISSITDVNGKKEDYEYDSFNRLWRVLNHEGLVIKEYHYHIKTY